MFKASVLGFHGVGRDKWSFIREKGDLHGSGEGWKIDGGKRMSLLREKSTDRGFAICTNIRHNPAKSTQKRDSKTWNLKLFAKHDFYE